MLKLMNNQFLLIAPITCPKFDAVILLRTAAHNEFLRWPACTCSLNDIFQRNNNLIPIAMNQRKKLQI